MERWVGNLVFATEIQDKEIMNRTGNFIFFATEITEDTEVFTSVSSVISVAKKYIKKSLSIISAAKFLIDISQLKSWRIFQCLTLI